jgi:hypothetical protein
MAAVERSLQRSIIGVDKAMVRLRAMSDTLVDLDEITSNLPGRPAGLLVLDHRLMHKASLQRRRC